VPQSRANEAVAETPPLEKQTLLSSMTSLIIIIINLLHS